MHIAVVTENIPNPSTGGGALTAWSLIEVLQQSGNRVSAVSLLPADPSSNGEETKRLVALQHRGIEVLCLRVVSRNRISSFQRTFFPQLADYYPWVSTAQPTYGVLKRLQPDAVLTYHWAATASTHGLKEIPRMAVLGDPDYLVSDYRERLPDSRKESHPTNGSWPRAVLSRIRRQIDSQRQPASMLELLQNCQKVGFFAAHHATWAQKNGVPHCLYLRTPIPDERGPDWESLRQANSGARKPKILMIGHVQGTATWSGLDLFARETLPILESELDSDSFEVHLVGGETLPEDLKGLLDRPCVKLRGHVEPAADEFLSSDVLLVPTPIELGIRVRILVGWSFGCCVVAHRANASGIPEMIHEKNALLAADGRGLAFAILQALTNHKLRDELGRNGRQTYETYFSYATAGRTIVAELEELKERQRVGAK